MRKKDLRAKLEQANYRITNLLGENEILRESNVELLKTNGELRQQLDTFDRVSAFIKGDLEPPRGPTRPNRKKLTDQEVRDIRDAYYGGARQRDLAVKFGVNPATISRTVRGIYH